MEINICKIIPNNYFGEHSQVFDEMEVATTSAFKNLGYTVINSINEFRPNMKNLVFNMHQIPVDVARHLVPKGTIVYNFEQIGLDSNRVELNRWVKKYRGLEIWDYSKKNIEAYKRLGIPGLENTKYVPVGSSSEYVKFDRNAVKDIDILFFGQPGGRRERILKELESNKNINFVMLHKVYGKERNDMIGRAKLVINTHSQDTEILEMVRLSNLFMNKIPVLSERNPGTEVPDFMDDVILTATHDNFVKTALELIQKPHYLDQCAEVTYQRFAENPIDKFIAEALK